MNRKMVAFLMAGAAVLTIAGCGAENGTASTEPSESVEASTEVSTEATETPTAEPPAAMAAEEAESGADQQQGLDTESPAGAADLTEIGTIGDVSYMYSADWQASTSTDSVAVYGFTVGTSDACSIEVAAMPAAVYEGAEANGEDLATLMLQTLGVTDPTITAGQFKGVDGWNFSGTGASSQAATGHIVQKGDNYYIFLFLSVGSQSAEATGIWEAFQEHVTIS